MDDTPACDEGPRSVREPRRRDSVDWYEVLEVSPRASQVVIHAAYRALARESHPDRNPTPEALQRIQQVNAAFWVLGNQENRARYDLQCARSRRYERTVRSDQHPVATIESRGIEPLQGRMAVLRQSAEPTFSVRNTHIFLGLFLVTTLAMLVLVLVWLSIDAMPDDRPPSVLPIIELSKAKSAFD